MDGQRGTTILDPRVITDADAHRAAFLSADPFPHVVIDNFLDAGFIGQLLAEFPTFEQGNFIGDDGRPGGKSTLGKVRPIGASYERLDDAIKSPEFLAAVGRLTGIDDLLYDPWYLGGGTHENRNGMSLDPHVDFNFHPSERWHRRINLIIYLNPLWENAWGGNLELFRDPHVEATPTQSVAPVFNRCVIFETSERSWHAFDQIALPAEHMNLTRRSVALYFYTKDRPQEEIADRHTTYYVKRQLPDQLAEGHTLSAVDVATIRGLISQRDGHIKVLYEENTRLLKAQDKGLAGQLLYLAKRAYVRFRR
ncbi:2OG-Fe(II) oxygenase [Luteibacter anthropi]|uniref:2OG-Fe(II) oxygenase n=1 Tax=Luteibacter anthropi TaxID=564369 RepID=UPI002032C2D7|nr:2OG-Fe(II) oxygenase [Luteibacter anthropi]URX60955.1 2OG-Fe(II) oxygenase [Luteibacter anthropi]